jgi:hypothetical protein
MLRKQSLKKSKLKQWYLNYFDWNHDGEVNWWEYFIPFGLILGIEIIAELIGLLISNYFF